MLTYAAHVCSRMLTFKGGWQGSKVTVSAQDADKGISTLWLDKSGTSTLWRPPEARGGGASGRFAVAPLRPPEARLLANARTGTSMPSSPSSSKSKVAEGAEVRLQQEARLQQDARDTPALSARIANSRQVVRTREDAESCSPEGSRALLPKPLRIASGSG
jgi:hypothetical protein